MKASLVRTVLRSVIVLTLMSMAAAAATLQVGPGKQYATPCKAIAAAVAGDTIEIDGTGTYNGDVCGWATSNLTIRGVNGRPVINAAGANYGGKGTWVVDGDNIVIENVELMGAAVPDRNGAAIRAEGMHLTVRYSYIHDNQDGILTNNIGQASVTIEYTEFANNGYGDGQSHNLYVGAIQSLAFRFNYSHGAKVGHLLKSRAATNYILYNRLSDESTGTASYELDLPSGGRSYVIGNLIQQGPSTQNSTMLAYLEEGSIGTPTDLYVVNNTFVNQYPSGTFINIASSASPAVIKNNVFYGPGTMTNQSSALKANNLVGDPGFVSLANYDYHLVSGSPAINAGADPGTGAGYSLLPTFQYVHPACGEGRTTVGIIDIGAYEYGGGTGALAGTGTCVTSQQVTGSVSAAGTAKPIPGATVSYSAGSTTTDANGSYLLAGVPVGTYSVTAAAGGYAAATQSVTLSAGMTATANFSLAATSTPPPPPPPITGALQGHVSSAIDGHALSGVLVRFSGGTATTNANGNYSFAAVAPGTYSVTFSSSGWLSRSASVSVTAGTTSTLNMSLATAGQIAGTIRNSAGTVLSGATVRIAGGVIHTSLTRTTGSGGTYNSGWIPVGTYTITVSRYGYTTRSRTVTVNTGLTTTANFTMY